MGTGGMASKLAAAKMATWSGVRTVIAAADRPAVLVDAVAGVGGVGTFFAAREQKMSARKVWIAFAIPSVGRITVDEGARVALAERGRSLLAAGVVGVDHDFQIDQAVDIVDPSGAVFAKGLVSWPAAALEEFRGRHSSQSPRHLADAVVHRDRMVLLPVAGRA